MILSSENISMYLLFLVSSLIENKTLIKKIILNYHCFYILAYEVPIVFKSLNIKVIQATSSENILQTLHNFKSALLLTLSCMQISLM